MCVHINKLKVTFFITEVQLLSLRGVCQGSCQITYSDMPAM